MGNPSGSGLSPEQRFLMLMKTLEQRGCPKFIVSYFAAVKKEVLDFASKLQIKPNNVPFLPVIGTARRNICDLAIHYLMTMVRNVREIGCADLEPARIFDLSHQGQILGHSLEQTELYFIFDVDDGDATRPMDPFAARDFILRNNRTPLNVFDAVSLCTHTNTLKHHYVWAMRSIYNLGNVNDEQHRAIPIIYLSNGRPRLWYLTPAIHQQYSNEVQPNKFGAPSYARKLKIILS